MLPVDGDQALVADSPGQHVDLLLQLVHRQHAALLQRVAFAETAVSAAVHAQVGHVERREHHYPVVVDLALDAVGGRPHLLEERGIRHLHENGRLLRLQRFAGGLALGDYLANLYRVGRLAVDVGDYPLDAVAIYEMLAAGEILVDLLLDDEPLSVVRGVRELAYA